MDLMYGTQDSNCSKPCTSTKVYRSSLIILALALNCLLKVSGRFLSGNGQNANSIIVLTMNQEVTITESFIPEFSISTFFADLGGSLGLWLGVGAVQLLSSGLGLATEVCARLGFYRK